MGPLGSTYSEASLECREMNRAWLLSQRLEVNVASYGGRDNFFFFLKSGRDKFWRRQNNVEQQKRPG